MNNYVEIIKNNIQRLYQQGGDDLAEKLPAGQTDDGFLFNAFGELCRVGPEGIKLGNKFETGPVGIIISLYALQVEAVDCQLTPYKAFREFPDSMPYVNAFAANAERILVDHIDKIEHKADGIVQQFKCTQDSGDEAGDFSMLVYPLPKIALNYIFYKADDEFPASVTCLFSNNAATFLPTDALADTGEYTSKKILDLI